MITIHLIISTLFAMPMVSSTIVGVQTAEQIYQTVEEVPEEKLGLIMGAAAYPAYLSDILQDRMDTGIELYKSGKVEKLVMTGAPNESESMREYAIENGVKPSDILEDPKGLNTLASIQNLAKKSDSLIIITQKYHLPRALFLANVMGIEAVGLVAKEREYSNFFDFRKRELVATSKAIFDVYFK